MQKADISHTNDDIMIKRSFDNQKMPRAKSLGSIPHFQTFVPRKKLENSSATIFQAL
jgi:hypothetical protein